MWEFCQHCCFFPEPSGGCQSKQTFSADSGQGAQTQHQSLSDAFSISGLRWRFHPSILPCKYFPGLFEKACLLAMEHMIPPHHRGFIQCSITGPGQHIKRMLFHKNPALLFPVFQSLCISCLIASGIRVIISWCLFTVVFLFFFFFLST